MIASLPWAGIGALLMGAGALFSGLAAYKVASKNHEPEAEAGDPDRNG